MGTKERGIGMRGKVVLFALATVFCLSCLLARAQETTPQTYDLGDGYVGRLVLGQDPRDLSRARKYVQIKFPESCLQTNKDFGECVYSALAKTFDCEEMFPECPPKLVDGRDAAPWGTHFYINTKFDSRVIILPLYEEDTGKVIGVMFTPDVIIQSPIT